MGTLMLDHVAEARSHGREIETAYRHRLAELPGLAFLPEAASGVVQNHAFMPILVDPVAFGMSRDRLAERLAAYNVRARRYFYPLISDMAGYRHLEAGDPLSEARKVGQRILALPTYSRLAITDVHRICDLIIAIYQGRDQYHA
jgi:dTDP-4-amino-4,6-dideoxygalactose transaminase